ncbi:MAG: C25 family cysteine peptidase [Bacteroidota bacterium]
MRTWPFPLRTALLAFAALFTAPALAQVQADGFDPSWYDAGQPHVKLSVVEDGVYRVTGAELAALGANGIDLSTLALIENGRRIPVHLDGNTSGSMQASDALVFVGRQNRGDDELWAYNDGSAATQSDPSLQSSDRFSLFSDTTTYWLTWGGTPGPRYETVDPDTFADGATTIRGQRDTTHFEVDSATLYYPGDPAQFRAGHPYYTRAEGYYRRRFRHDAPNTDVVFTEQVRLGALLRNTGESLSATLRFNGGSGATHFVSVEVEVKDADGNLIYEPFGSVSWGGYSFAEVTGEIEQNRVANTGVVPFRITSTSTGSVNSNHYLDWVRVEHTREFTPINDTPTGQRGLIVESGRTTFSMRGFSEAPTVFSPDDLRRFVTRVEGNTFVFSTETDQTRRMSAVQPGAFLGVAGLTFDAASDLASSSNAADYVIVTPAALRPSAEAHAAYRRSAAGGGHSVVVVELRDVFDQFDYGRPTPNAIRRFVRQTKAWSQAPRFLMLWGDDIYRFRTDPQPEWWLPSYGNAVSDAWFGMQSEGPGDLTEIIAIGRVPLRTNAEGTLFTGKIQRSEGAPPDTWQKRAILMSGGEGAGEQASFRAYIQGVGLRVSDRPVGADTVFFHKTSDEVLDTSLQDSIRVAIQDGAAFLTYLGHSAAETWEIVIDDPEDFGNEDRLPVVFSLGCRTGNFAALADRGTLAERLVLGSEAGSIAHWGSSELGRVPETRSISDLAHQVIFTESREGDTDTTRVLGLALQEAKRRYATTFAFGGVAYYPVKHLLQYGLIGDPASRIVLPTQPDLTVADSDVRISPAAPLVEDRLLTTDVRVRNRGLIPLDSLSMTVRQERPTRGDTLITRRLAPFGLDTTVTVTLPLADGDAGTHFVSVTADALNDVSEFNESNNFVSRKPHVVFSNGLAVVFPQDFATVDKPQPRLRVSLASPRTAQGVAVRFEIDRVPTFDSPAKQSSASILIRNAHADWTPAEPLPDDQPAYWRARIDAADQVENWVGGRLLVQTNEAPGRWTMTGDLFDAVTTDGFLTREDDAWIFTDYRVNVQTNSEAEDTSRKGQFVVNSGSPLLRLDPGFGMLVLDGTFGTVRGAEFGAPYNPGQAEAGVAVLDSLVTEVALPGDYIFVRTRNLFQSGPVPDNLRALLQTLGSESAPTLNYEDMLLLVTQKDRPGTTWEQVFRDGPDQPDFVLLDTTLTFQNPAGQLSSPRVGPAKAWRTLTLDTDVAGNPAFVSVDVLAADGSVLIGDLRSPTIDLSSIDARAHPFLTLRATLSDVSQQSTPQLRRWQVIYDPVPELVLDPDLFELPTDALAEGQPLRFEVPVRNLSLVAPDSVRVRATLTDPDNEQVEILVTSRRDVPPDSVLMVPVEAVTVGRVGQNGIQAEASQPSLTEALTYNNALVGDFRVAADATEPVLRVWIDDAEVRNGPERVFNTQDPAIPYVSARPRIRVSLTDSNPFLRLDDPGAFTLTLNDEEVDPAAVVFEAATDDENEARLTFEPAAALTDTLHTLTIEARDATGNPARIANVLDREIGGPAPTDSTTYRAYFRVQSEMELESVFPYPNPMVSSTRFMFRLRGADAALVEDLRIRIYTINGRLIRELRPLECLDTAICLPGARIGWNDVAWDGRDEDGDLVASGVYLYQVFLRADGQSLTPSNDPIGKIAVIR